MQLLRELNECSGMQCSSLGCSLESTFGCCTDQQEASTSRSGVVTRCTF